ncbi:translation initiation factor eIF-1A [Candidatus Woesearchaeota archaeon]|nr:translation initiation factor eIF-1A [Candidatus Woesearchaeota archaeon]
MGKKKEEMEAQQKLQMEISRIHMPRGKEVFAILVARLGGSRIKAKCLDGKERICRIPGRLKRKLWVREGDLIIVEPWEFNADDRGDILYKYSNAQVEYLKRRDLLKGLDAFEEF